MASRSPLGIALTMRSTNPRGVVSTNRDPSGRPRVIDLLPPHGVRMFAVGRLDLNSEGLILVTNDGELAQPLDASQVRGREDLPGPGCRPAGARNPGEAPARCSSGRRDRPGERKSKSSRIRRKARPWRWVLREGRNREVRRLLARVGHKVPPIDADHGGARPVGKTPAGLVSPVDPTTRFGMLRHVAKEAADHG